VSDPGKAGGRIGSAPGFATPPAPPPRSLRWLWISLLVVGALVAAGAGFMQRTKQSFEHFALRLELKTPEGMRTMRVAGNDVTIEDHPKKGKDVTTVCGIEMREALGLQSLASSKLVEEGLEGRPVAGTFQRSVGANGEVSNGDMDAETADAVSSYILRHATGCVTKP
jgi:hypothetical protein